MAGWNASGDLLKSFLLIVGCFFKPDV